MGKKINLKFTAQGLLKTQSTQIGLIGTLRVNPHESMTDCYGNPMQFMVLFLVHPISLHCLLNFSMMCSYSVLALTISFHFLSHDSCSHGHGTSVRAYGD